MSLCRACFDICEQSNSSPIIGDLKNMLEFCLPELDLNITENPVLCKVCQSSLKDVNEFKMKCLATQKKIQILTNCTPKRSLNTTVEPIVPQKIVEKVAPFKLKLSSRNTEPSKKITSKKNQTLKRRYTEVTPIISKTSQPHSLPECEDDDEEDFLNMLDGSDNVNNPKVRKLSPPPYIKSEDSKNLDEKEIDETRRFECKLCNKSFSVRRTLNAHIATSAEHKNRMAQVSSGFQLYKCDKCPFVTKYKIGLNKHYPVCLKGKKLSGKPNTSPGKSSTSGFACKVCSIVIKTKSSLAAHMSRKHNAVLTIHKCESCNFQTSTKNKLHYHKKTVHKKLCDESPREPKLNPNIETDDNGIKNIFECTFVGCKRKYQSRKKWLKHRSQHYTEPIKCPICSKEFDSENGRNKHLAFHKKQEASGANNNELGSNSGTYDVGAKTNDLMQNNGGSTNDEEYGNVEPLSQVENVSTVNSPENAAGSQIEGENENGIEVETEYQMDNEEDVTLTLSQETIITSL